MRAAAALPRAAFSGTLARFAVRHRERLPWIHPGSDNAQGFQPGDWIPYLTVSYLVQKQHGARRNFGTFMAMTAADGPHYGADVKLDGPGRYTLTLQIEPPPYAAFFRHTTKQTGVARRWKPFTVHWTFVSTANGKLGGY